MGIENDFGSSEFNFEDIFGQTPEEAAQENVDLSANNFRLDKHVDKLKITNPDAKGWAVVTDEGFQTYDNFDVMFGDLENRGVDLKRLNIMKLDQPSTLII